MRQKNSPAAALGGGKDEVANAWRGDSNFSKCSTGFEGGQGFSLEQVDCVPGTIVFDRIVDYLVTQGETQAWALKSALVFGTILRYERMKNGFCHASVKTIVKNMKCCARHFYRHRDSLVTHGLITDHTPQSKKPHHYTISQQGYDILGLDSRARLCDFLSQSEEDSRARLCDFLSPESDRFESHKHEEEDEDAKLFKLKKALPSFAVLEAECGPVQNGMLARIQWLYDDPSLSNAWLDEAILATASAGPAKPLAYLNKTVKDYLANGGPPEVATREVKSKGRGKPNSSESDDQRTGESYRDFISSEEGYLLEQGYTVSFVHLTAIFPEKEWSKLAKKPATAREALYSRITQDHNTTETLLSEREVYHAPN